MATYLTTTGKQYLAVMLDCGGAGNASCNPFYVNMSTCAVAGAAAGDTGIFSGAQNLVPTVMRTTATCEYNSAVDTWAIIATVCTCVAGPSSVIRAGAYWMSSSGPEQGLFISGDHTAITGLAANDQVQYTITLQFT